MFENHAVLHIDSRNSYYNFIQSVINMYLMRNVIGSIE